MKALLAMTAVCGFAALASAGVDGIQLGTGAPPADIIGRAMTPAPADSRIFSDVSSVPSGLPGGGDYSFSSPLSCRQIGLGWATWSHGYAGNVYYTNGSLSTTITMPSGVQAFYAYAEPNPFGVFNMTATASDGGGTKSFTEGVEGSAGAKGWGFYGTAGSDIATVQISGDVDFAVGEFGGSRVPAPATLGLLGLGGMLSGRRRRA